MITQPHSSRKVSLMRSSSSCNPDHRLEPRGDCAFTRVDAAGLVLAGALLAGALAPLHATQQSASHSAVCQANLGRLQAAFDQFCSDNQGVLPYSQSSSTTWVRGWMDRLPDATNTSYLLDGKYAQLGPYVADVRVFKCPSDLSYVKSGTNSYSRVRSYSMSCAINNPAGGWIPNSYQKLSEIVDPPPSKIWAFIDEHPDSINDGMFGFILPATPADTAWFDWPANHHDRAGSLSFVDGHTELHRWQDKISLSPTRYAPAQTRLSSPNSADVSWLAERTIGRR